MNVEGYISQKYTAFILNQLMKRGSLGSNEFSYVEVVASSNANINRKH